MVHLNQKQLMIQRNKIAHLCVFESSRHRNCIRFGLNEGDAHIDEKVKIAKKLRREGKKYITEAVFKTGGRADILCLDDGIAYEIVDSEKEESIEIKKEKYPKELEIVAIVVK